MLYVDNYSTSYQNCQPSLFPLQEDPPPFPIQIASISHQQRLKADWGCKLVHYESGLKLPGQFTYDEAKEILEITRYWDFTLDSKRIPKCRDRLLVLLEKVCRDRVSSKSEEVAA
ncbi:MAG TPA: hypothetical protein V6C71_27165 [Coleofasciculaceae cyanobacterium]|jgi:hypothetical protein